LYKFTPGQLLAGGDPAPVTTLTASGAIGGVIEPCAIAFDPNGNLWVTSLTNAVSEFSASQLNASGAPSPAVTVSGSGFNLPCAVATRPI
jgi:streptogramin lyase